MMDKELEPWQQKIQDEAVKELEEKVINPLIGPPLKALKKALDKRGFLILTLKHGEHIQLGEDIRISLSKDESKNFVRVAFKAPRDINIKRIKSEME